MKKLEARRIFHCKPMKIGIYEIPEMKKKIRIIISERKKLSVPTCMHDLDCNLLGYTY